MTKKVSLLLTKMSRSDYHITYCCTIMVHAFSKCVKKLLPTDKHANLKRVELKNTYVNVYHKANTFMVQYILWFSMNLKKLELVHLLRHNQMRLNVTLYACRSTSTCSVDYLHISTRTVNYIFYTHFQYDFRIDDSRIYLIILREIQKKGLFMFIKRML